MGFYGHDGHDHFCGMVLLALFGKLVGGVEDGTKAD
jgi:hypothetical protein